VSEHIKRLSDNTYVKLSWALAILSSCMFAAFRVGCMCKEIESLQQASAQREAIVKDHEKRITGCETWARVHEVKDTASP
jgi:hypothetical protein